MVLLCHFSLFPLLHKPGELLLILQYPIQVAFLLEAFLYSPSLLISSASALLCSYACNITISNNNLPHKLLATSGWSFYFQCFVQGWAYNAHSKILLNLKQYPKLVNSVSLIIFGNCFESLKYSDVTWNKWLNVNIPVALTTGI